MKSVTVGITYDVVTEESAEYGDYAESGWRQELQLETFRDAVEGIRRRGVAHFEHAYNGFRVVHWPDVDVRTGDTTTETTHIIATPKVCRRLLKFIR